LDWYHREPTLGNVLSDPTPAEKSRPIMITIARTVPISSRNWGSGMTCTYATSASW